MKKIGLIVIVIILIAFKAVAADSYFDVGLGFGMIGNTEFDDSYFAKDIFTDNRALNYDTGFKIGAKILKEYPLYLVGNASVFGKTIENDEDSKDYLWVNSFLIGPGLVAYPLPFIQVGTSFGYSFTLNKSNLNSVEFEDGKGFATNATIAYEYKDKANNKALIGLSYSISRNTTESDNVEKLSVFSIFIKYSYRLDNSGFFLNKITVN